MADQIRVEPEDLQMSAVKVESQAEELYACHAASDSRIGDAVAGVPLTAAAALAAARAKWYLETTVLHGRISGHGEALSSAATAFTRTESHNTADVSAVGDEGSAPNLDL